VGRDIDTPLNVTPDTWSVEVEICVMMTTAARAFAPTAWVVFCVPVEE
jgi:hypothetical protein